MELIILRLIIKLAASILAFYLVITQVGSGTAKLCYKSACFAEANKLTEPIHFWVLISVYFIMFMALLISSRKEIQQIKNKNA